MPVHVPEPYTVIKKVPYQVKVPVDKPYEVKIHVPKPYEVIKKVCKIYHAILLWNTHHKNSNRKLISLIIMTSPNILSPLGSIRSESTSSATVRSGEGQFLLHFQFEFHLKTDDSTKEYVIQSFCSTFHTP